MHNGGLTMNSSPLFCPLTSVSLILSSLFPPVPEKRLRRLPADLSAGAKRRRKCTARRQGFAEKSRNSESPLPARRMCPLLRQAGVSLPAPFFLRGDLCISALETTTKLRHYPGGGKLASFFLILDSSISHVTPSPL